MSKADSAPSTGTNSTDESLDDLLARIEIEWRAEQESASPGPAPLASVSQPADAPPVPSAPATDPAALAQALAEATLDVSEILAHPAALIMDAPDDAPAPTPGTSTAAEPAPESAATSDRRQARRRPASEFGQDLRLTLPGAAEARPVDVSATGVLTETTHRLCPGRTVDLFLRLNGIRRVLRARVVRSFVHAVSPRPLFRAALQFEDPCRLPECDE